MTEANRPAVAAFDFDGTLTDRDSVVPFLRSIAGTVAIARRMLRRPGSLLSAAVRRDRDRIKELATAAAFTGRPIAEIQAAADRYGAALVAERLREDTAARLRWHREAGHVVVIVSASYELYLHSVARALSIDGVVATRLETDADAFTGRLVGANCRGAEKVRRLDVWLADRGLDRSTCTLYAYGDSAGDRALLAAANHPQWVGEGLDSVAPAV